MCFVHILLWQSNSTMQCSADWSKHGKFQRKSLTSMKKMHKKHWLYLVTAAEKIKIAFCRSSLKDCRESLWGHIETQELAHMEMCYSNAPRTCCLYCLYMCSECKMTVTNSSPCIKSLACFSSIQVKTLGAFKPWSQIRLFWYGNCISSINIPTFLK